MRPIDFYGDAIPAANIRLLLFDLRPYFPLLQQLLDAADQLVCLADVAGPYAVYYFTSYHCHHLTFASMSLIFLRCNDDGMLTATWPRSLLPAIAPFLL